MRALAVAFVAMAGCAAPFDAITTTSATSGVTLTYCGSQATSAESVMKSLEPPTNVPSEVGGNGGISDEKELRVCIRLENKGSEPARVDRSNIRLKCPAEVVDAAGDHDDVEVIAHPGETREFHVSFRYAPLVHGEDVAVLLDKAVKVGGKAARFTPLKLRKR